MTEINGLQTITFEVSAGITKIHYDNSHSLDICNGSKGDIYVSTQNNFEGREYFIIPQGGSYNGYRIGGVYGGDVYIKSTESGTVSIVCGRY